MGSFEIGIIVGVLILAAVLLDAFIRSRGENKNPYRLSINNKKAKAKNDQFSEEDGFTSELPNGGARVVPRKNDSAQQKAGPKSSVKSKQSIADSDVEVPLESGIAATDDHDPLDELASLATGLDDSEDPMEAVNKMLSEKSELGSLDSKSQEKAHTESTAVKTHKHEVSKTESVGDKQNETAAQKATESLKAGSQESQAKDLQETAVEEKNKSVQGDLLEELKVEDETPSKEPEEVLILHVMSTAGGFKGGPLLQILRACDLRFGDLNIFHRYEEANGNGAIQFGVANMIKPGTFDINTMDTFKTPGITLFLPLPGPKQALKAYDYMVETAQCVADNLHGELKDESLSVVTEQTLEHGRQRVRDFERQRLSSKD